MKCALVDDVSSLVPGWLCCGCRTYNGLHRSRCKHCGHLPCALLPPVREAVVKWVDRFHPGDQAFAERVIASHETANGKVVA
jgi:hypothetical protein